MAMPSSINCNTDLGTRVEVRRRGGVGGSLLYGGGFIDGFHGHEHSLLSPDDMRKIAAALTQAADAIDAAGLPSLKNREAFWGKKSY